MRRRHRRMGEGARRLARPGRRVDPTGAEELAPDIGQLRREGIVGIEHDLLGLGPGDRAVVMLGQRRIAIPVGHRLDTEPLGLELVVAMGELRVGRLHRGRERIDDFVLDHVGQIAERLRAGVLAPPVVDFLVLDQRVGDQREDRDIVALDLAERLGGLLAHRGVLVRQLVEDLRLAQHLVAERIAQPRDRLVEQARPGAAADHRLVVLELLQLVGELVRPEQAGVAQPRTVLGQFRRLQLLGEVGILDLVDLQPEEQELRADVVQLLGDVLGKAVALRIGQVLGGIELCVGADPPQQVAHRLEAHDRGPQRLAVEPDDPALVIPGKGLRLNGGALQIGIEVRPARAGIEVGQIPGRQIAQHNVHSPLLASPGIWGAIRCVPRGPTSCPGGSPRKCAGLLPPALARFPARRAPARSRAPDRSAREPPRSALLPPARSAAPPWPR